jgi:hypothetical protein
MPTPAARGPFTWGLARVTPPPHRVPDSSRTPLCACRGPACHAPSRPRARPFALPQGAECFGFFSQLGLDKAVLRDAWSLVAGSEGRLSGPQFVAFMYLADLVKRGRALPPALPPGLAGFPPVAAAALPSQPAAPPAAQAAPPAAATAAPAWSLQSQFGTASNIGAVLAGPSPSPMAPPPPLAALPQRLDFGVAPPLPGAAGAAAGAGSRVPLLPEALLAGVTAMERCGGGGRGRAWGCWGGGVACMCMCMWGPWGWHVAAGAVACLARLTPASATDPPRCPASARPQLQAAGGAPGAPRQRAKSPCCPHCTLTTS